LLPGGGDVRVEAQIIDAGMVQLEVAPESQGERHRQVVQRAVVDRRLTFPQVLHQQIPNRATFDLVAVDKAGGVGRPEMLGGAPGCRSADETTDGLQGPPGQLDGDQPSPGRGVGRDDSAESGGVDLQQGHTGVETDPSKGVEGDHARGAGCVLGGDRTLETVERVGFVEPPVGDEQVRRCGPGEPRRQRRDDIEHDQRRHSPADEAT
jgi:hypothetical protein